VNVPIRMLNPSRHRSLLTPSMASSSSSKRGISCLGFISPRSATLLLALFGLIAHIQQFNYLGILHDTFPHVPKVRSIASTSTTIETTRPSLISGGANVVLDSEVVAAEEEQASRIETQTQSLVNDITDSVKSNASTSVWKDAAVKRPIRWFNLLPSRYQQPSDNNNKTPTSGGASIAYTAMDQDYKARQRDQEADRKSWEAARTLTRAIRWYAAMCAFAALCGVIGVIRSNLFCTRIFVLVSTLDLLWCALSLISLGIIVTYPNIRSLICEELSNTSTVILDLDQSSGNNLRSTTGPVMLLSRAASTFWKRSSSSLEASVPNPADTLSSGYWWDSLLDNILENENCEDVLESVLLPLGLVACLIYLALR
jgi:hypothetical protein